jgi:hypothetical protein
MWILEPIWSWWQKKDPSFCRKSNFDCQDYIANHFPDIKNLKRTVDWIQLDQLWALVKAAVNLRVSYNARNYLTSWATVNFSRNVLLCGQIMAIHQTVILCYLKPQISFIKQEMELGVLFPESTLRSRILNSVLAMVWMTFIEQDAEYTEKCFLCRRHHKFDYLTTDHLVAWRLSPPTP